MRFHFLRELTKAGTVELLYCFTQEQMADIMTEPLMLNVFLKLRDMNEGFSLNFSILF